VIARSLVNRAMRAFHGEHDRPVEELLRELLEERFERARYDPDAREVFIWLAKFVTSPNFYEQFDALMECLDGKIAAAGFADSPQDYLWRPILDLDKAMTFTEVKGATFREIIEANEALDRREARRQKKEDGRKTPLTRGEQACKIATLMLETGQATTVRGGLTKAAEKIKPMLDVEMSLGGIKNAIRHLFNTQKLP
jgi:hypothetical protein